MTVLLGFDVTTNASVTSPNSQCMTTPFVALTTGTATEAVLRCATANKDVTIAVYDSSDNLLSTGEFTTDPVYGEKDYICTLNTPVSIVQGQTYRLGYIVAGGLEVFINNTNSLWWNLADATVYPAVPDPFVGTSTSNKREIRLFLRDSGVTYTIASIDGDNNVQAGQTNVSIVTSGIDPASVTQAVTLGGETLTINSWTDSGGNALINVDISADINVEWGTTHELAVTHDGGTTTLSGVTLSAPTGWETVAFSTIPDTGTTESFYEYSQSDVTVGNFTAQVGDTLAFTSSTGLTIDGSSIPVVNPAATVTGSYKWWDASLSTWTPVSSYTITNLGVFGGSDTTVMIQEMISDMISEMVN